MVDAVYVGATQSSSGPFSVRRLEREREALAAQPHQVARTDPHAATGPRSRGCRRRPPRRRRLISPWAPAPDQPDRQSREARRVRPRCACRRRDVRAARATQLPPSAPRPRGEPVVEQAGAVYAVGVGDQRVGEPARPRSGHQRCSSGRAVTLQGRARCRPGPSRDQVVNSANPDRRTCPAPRCQTRDDYPHLHPAASRTPPRARPGRTVNPSPLGCVPSCSLLGLAHVDDRGAPQMRAGRPCCTHSSPTTCSAGSARADHFNDQPRQNPYHHGMTVTA